MLMSGSDVLLFRNFMLRKAFFMDIHEVFRFSPAEIPSSLPRLFSSLLPRPPFSCSLRPYHFPISRGRWSATLRIRSMISIFSTLGRKGRQKFLWAGWFFFSLLFSRLCSPLSCVYSFSCLIHVSVESN